MFESMVLNPLTALRRTADADRIVRIADLVEPLSHSLPPEDRTRPLWQLWPLKRQVAGESLTVRHTPDAHVAQMEEPNLVARAILAVRERAVTGAGQSDVGT